MQRESDLGKCICSRYSLLFLPDIVRLTCDNLMCHIDTEFLEYNIVDTKVEVLVLEYTIICAPSDTVD